jgi:hypothetical protein
MAAVQPLAALPADAEQALLLPARYEAVRVYAQQGQLDKAAGVIDEILKGAGK